MNHATTLSSIVLSVTGVFSVSHCLFSYEHCNIEPSYFIRHETFCMLFRIISIGYFLYCKWQDILVSNIFITVIQILWIICNQQKYMSSLNLKSVMLQFQMFHKYLGRELNSPSTLLLKIEKKTIIKADIGNNVHMSLSEFFVFMMLIILTLWIVVTMCVYVFI